MPLKIKMFIKWKNSSSEDLWKDIFFFVVEKVNFINGFPHYSMIVSTIGIGMNHYER